MRHMPRTILDNRYALLDSLGSGGMAEVHLAHDEVLGRDVALKALRSQYASDAEFVERFRREARSAASLSHPNIVQIFDQGRAEDGTYYMAMEYVPGGTLKERIAENGPMGPREAAGIVTQVAEALGVAHKRGIVHRDIKPQNVLMTSTGIPKVADFGIARAASATVVTQTNLVLGTAGYMSPEQAEGERVGPASDLYSLGVVLYEMLTGALPYEADTPIAVAMKHINAPPRHPKEANPDVPEALDAVTVKLMAKDPAERYASAEELAKDLERIRDGLPPVAAGVGDAATSATARTRLDPDVTAPIPKPVASTRRRRGGLLPVLLGIAALLVLGGLGWALSQGGGSGGGAGQVEVPKVVGLPRDEAVKKLEEAGFRAAVSEKESSADKEGTVLDQSVAGGDKADRGSRIELTVGKGPSTVKVPDIPYGATPSQAKAQLEKAGLKLGSQSEASSDTVAQGGVVSQDPFPNTEVRSGSVVNITLSSGPAPAPAPESTVQSAPTQSSQPSQQAAPSQKTQPSQQTPTGSQSGTGAQKQTQDIQKQVQQKVDNSLKKLGKH